MTYSEKSKTVLGLLIVSLAVISAGALLGAAVFVFKGTLQMLLVCFGAVFLAFLVFLGSFNRRIDLINLRQEAWHQCVLTDPENIQKAVRQHFGRAFDPVTEPILSELGAGIDGYSLDDCKSITDRSVELPRDWLWDFLGKGLFVTQDGKVFWSEKIIKTALAMNRMPSDFDPELDPQPQGVGGYID